MDFVETEPDVPRIYYEGISSHASAFVSYNTIDEGTNREKRENWLFMPVSLRFIDLWCK